MADAAELNKMQETLDYFNRYYGFDPAIKTLRENRKYLETYIRTKHNVEDKIDVYGKTRKAMLLGLIVAAVGAFLVLLISGFSNLGAVNFIIAAVVAAVCFCGVFFGFKAYITSQVNKKWAEQQKENEDIRLQIEDVEKRCENLENQKNSYLEGLEEKKLTVIPVKYITDAKKIAAYLTDGKVETAEQAVAMYEAEQQALKEKGLAERKRREEEAAKARAIQLERERQRAIEEQRELELKKAQEAERRASQEAERLTVQESPAEKSAGLSLGGKTFARQEAPKKDTLQPASAAQTSKMPSMTENATSAEPEGKGLSLAMGSSGKKKPERSFTQTPQKPVAEPKAEQVQPEIHRADETLLGASGSKGLSLAMGSGKKKGNARQTAANVQKPAAATAPKNEPIRLVDEPDQTNEPDAASLDLQERMMSLLSHNSVPPRRNVTHIEESRVPAEEETVTPIYEEAAAPVAEETDPQISQEPEAPAPEEAVMPIPEVTAIPEPKPAKQENVLHFPKTQEEPPAEEIQPAAAEEPKSPFSGLAMKKKK